MTALHDHDSHVSRAIGRLQIVRIEGNQVRCYDCGQIAMSGLWTIWRGPATFSAPYRVCKPCWQAEDSSRKVSSKVTVVPMTGPRS